MTISVCTLAHGRERHLSNLVSGLARNRRQPMELVVAVMQDDEYDLPKTDFPVRQIIMGAAGIPLAQARNRAAAEAQGELLVFLDVDCIPGPECLADYAIASALNDGVFMGEVGYLPKGATDAGIDYSRFESVAVKHSERAGPPAGMVGECGDYRCFWSLNFALTKAVFAEIGGFDEGYDGYGGEDTDFGRTFVSQGQPLWWVRGAKAYHQYHPHHMPPVHHIDSVIRNAQYFESKWNAPTMEHWLRAFELMGLVKRDGHGGFIKIRDPGPAELALTRQQENAPYASASKALALMEERIARGEPAVPLAAMADA